MPESALDGVKVLDLTHHVAGPYCTKLLADFGADVVKIERPLSGDPTRRMAPFYHDEPDLEKSLLFAYLNTSKQSITLNLKSEDGRGILLRLAQEADILVENFSPRVMPSLGLGYRELQEANPELVAVSISNFGQSGPYRDFLATDLIEYALGGLSYIFGSNDRAPLKHALRQAQFKAGTNAASAALIGLYARNAGGEGQHIDVSIQECMASCLRDTTSLYTYTGAIRRRQPAFSGDIPRSPTKTRDGYIVPVSFGGEDWEASAELLQAPELLQPQFATPELRRQNAPELDEVTRAVFERQDPLELFRSAHERRGFIYGVVHSPQDLVESPQYQARGYFVDIEHPAMGAVKSPGAPVIMSGTPWRARSPAPTLGQHNREILGDRLGYPAAELPRMRASGVI